MAFVWLAFTLNAAEGFCGGGNIKRIERSKTIKSNKQKQTKPRMYPSAFYPLLARA